MQQQCTGYVFHRTLVVCVSLKNTAVCCLTARKSQSWWINNQLDTVRHKRSYKSETRATHLYWDKYILDFWQLYTVKTYGTKNTLCRLICVLCWDGSQTCLWTVLFYLLLAGGVVSGFTPVTYPVSSECGQYDLLQDQQLTETLGQVQQQLDCHHSQEQILSGDSSVLPISSTLQATTRYVFPMAH